MPRAVGCRWRPSTPQPSWYGVLGTWGTQGFLWVLSREGLPRLQTHPCASPSLLVLPAVAGDPPGPLLCHQPQTHPEILQQQDPTAGGSQDGAPSSFPPPALAHVRLPGTACLWKWGISPPPSRSWGCCGWFCPSGGQEGVQLHPRRCSYLPGSPKCLLSLRQVPGIPSTSVLKGSTLILVLHHSAGHQLGEVWGCDDQSAVSPFRAETPCGSAQRCQPHPTGFQRWVWVD